VLANGFLDEKSIGFRGCDGSAVRAILILVLIFSVLLFGVYRVGAEAIGRVCILAVGVSLAFE
jgi:hypothetical protein